MKCTYRLLVTGLETRSKEIEALDCELLSENTGPVFKLLDLPSGLNNNFLWFKKVSSIFLGRQYQIEFFVTMLEKKFYFGFRNSPIFSWIFALNCLSIWSLIRRFYWSVFEAEKRN